MTDRELLELAAKAAEIKDWVDGWSDKFWNPLTDDGDALRLAVKLDLFWEQMELFDIYMDNKPHEPKNVRRAIVRAAAEIGKGME